MLLLFALACAPDKPLPDTNNGADTTDAPVEADTAADTATDPAADTATDSHIDTHIDTHTDTDTGSVLDAGRAESGARAVLFDEGAGCTDLKPEYGDADDNGTVELIVECDDDRLIFAPAETEGTVGIDTTSVGSLVLRQYESYGGAGDATADGVLDLVVVYEPWIDSMGGEWIRYADAALYRISGPWSPGRTWADWDLRTNFMAYQTSSVAAILDDLDGDGVDDTVYAPGSDSGMNMHFLPDGGSSGDATDLSASGAAEKLVSPGDLDGDGQADLVTVNDGEVRFYPGPITGDVVVGDGAPYAEWFEDARGAGDVDGDGYADLLIHDGRGLFLVRGPLATGAIQNVAWLVVRGVFVGATAELDGDPGRELLLGSPEHDRGGIGAGAVHVFLTPAAGFWTLDDADYLWRGDRREGFGSAITPLPDLDGDGLDDVAVASSSAIYLFGAL